MHDKVARNEEALEVMRGLIIANSRTLTELVQSQRKMTDDIQALHDALAPRLDADALAPIALRDAEIARLRERLAAIEGSSSWKVTAPLRLTGRLSHRLGSAARSPRSAVKSAASWVLRKCARVILNSPLEVPARRLLLRFPAYASRLKNMAYAEVDSSVGQLSVATAAVRISHISHLTPRARVVYDRLTKTLNQDV